MLNTLYDWFDLHTTDTILASLDKMVARLRAHANKLNSQAVDAAATAAAAKMDSAIKAEAADKAHAVADKIGALIA